VRQADPLSVVSAVRSAIKSVDPTAAVSRERAMTEVISSSLGQPRFYLALLGTFAGIAILLAVAGLYGVLSYAVAQRTREIGIRTALGSTTGGIIQLVALDGLRLVSLGVVVGLAASLAATRLMTFMLYGVSPLDAKAWALAVVAMIVAGLLAASIPALRASRVDPLVAIQAE
jgi:ABC-type antimicrobial peptide transport system permease subunit